MGKINDESEIVYLPDDIDGYACKARFYLDVGNDDLFGLGDQKGLGKRISPSVIVSRDCPSICRQSQGDLVADELSGHQPDRYVERILARVLRAFVHTPTDVRKVPFLLVSLPGDQGSSARRADTATLRATRDVDDIHDPLVIGIEAKGYTIVSVVLGHPDFARIVLHPILFLLVPVNQRLSCLAGETRGSGITRTMDPAMR